MRKKKKDIPLTILKVLQPFVNLSNEKFQVVNSQEHLLEVIDIDRESSFYFRIEKHQKTANGKLQLLLDKRPLSEIEPASKRAWIDIDKLEPQFKDWLSILEEYDKTSSFYDDPIIKANSERFYQEYKLVDDDADYASFETERLLFLESYLDNTKTKLSILKDKLPKEDIIEIETLETEVEDIKRNLTKETKNQIMRRLSKVWGRAQKTGLPIIKEILISVASEFFKKLMIG